MQHTLTEPAAALRLWPAAEASVAPARHWLVRTLTAWELPQLADAATLVLSELLANAIQHADRSADAVVGSEIGARFLRLPDGALRIEVHDVSVKAPELRPADPASLDEHGRGLLLVDALTEGHWGVGERDGIGKLVWAHVRAR
ncbi:ATP-binding protein [Actinacidiphila alni]|uniref:ATP-binding protein n=1 Tax=Actinacidiphila alni TaxID=380248 RepID=UPI0033EA2459